MSSLVLIPLVIGLTYVGGWPFAVLWGIAAIGIWYEWSSLVSGWCAAAGLAGRADWHRRLRPYSPRSGVPNMP